jgi:glycosyltransferase involved in cell wall biosynthesis
VSPGGSLGQDGRVPRVVFLIDSLGWGGAERLLLDYLPHLRSQGFDPVVCALHERGGNPVADEIRALGIPVDTVPVERLRDPSALPRLVRYLRSRGADVVHTQLEFADGIGSVAARIARVPTVSTQHTMFEARRFSRSWARNRLGDLALAVASSTIIAVSDEARRHYEAARPYPRRKLVTLRNGIDLTRFDASAREGPAVRRELGIPPDAPVVLSVSVLRRDKGIQEMIAGLGSLAATAPGVVYLIVGDGDHRAALEAAARERGVAGRVVFAGSRTDVPRVMAAADVFVHPTYVDALPTVLAEAAAAGLPIVASRVGGVPEMCLDGRNGLLVPPGDVPALTAAVEGLLTDPALAGRMGAAGRQVARERFDIRTQAARLTDIYRRAMAR